MIHGGSYESIYCKTWRSTHNALKQYNSADEDLNEVGVLQANALKEKNQRLKL